MTLTTSGTESRRAASRKAGTLAEVIFYGIGECALGQVLVARSGKGVCAILLGDNREKLRADLAKRFPAAMLVSDKAFIQEELSKVIRFVGDPSERLDFQLDMRGTPTQRRVWRRLRSIAAGKTMTYLEIAKSFGEPRAVRVIANACAANSIALAIPCHRVIRSNGGLAGYRWGIKRKRELLRREAAA